ncbi:MAG: hypothetical protein HYT87_15510 [Nitrospirae bacterium]|nr:hypothetical protein [Nitrospirota bacterium]
MILHAYSLRRIHWALALVLAAMRVGGCTREEHPAACNGSKDLCFRRFDEVSYATAHNAMSNADDGWIGPNQEHGISRQLEDGIRGMMLDVHEYRGEPYLCHARCEFGRKSLAEGLAEIRAFMDRHPSEILSIIFESNVGAAEIEASFVESGLLGYVHAQTPGAPWPTLEAMIRSGDRLVVFTDFDGGALPWYHDVWEYAWETHYHFESAGEFTCKINRGRPENSLFIMNHFLTSPIAHPSLAEQVNFNPLLIDRAKQCWGESGRRPNFVTVDFYSIGDLFAVVDELNGLSSSGG